MSNELETISGLSSILKLDSNPDLNQGLSYNFDEDEEEIWWSKFDYFHNVDFLYRMIGRKDKEAFYVLKDYELESREVSLFNLKEEFLTENSHLCNNECFLQFMFFVVMSHLELSDRYMKNKRIAYLILKKVLQLASTDDIFKSKVEYIKISPLDKQKYQECADHWDLKYVEEHYSDDKDIQQLLYNCTVINDVSSHFVYSNKLTNKPVCLIG